MSSLLRVFGVTTGAVALLFGGFVFVQKDIFLPTQQYTASTTTAIAGLEKHIDIVKHQKTPKAVKAIYMSQCVAATKTFRAKLKRLVQDTELNAIIIDVKDYTGTVSFKTDNSKIPSHGAGCVSKDLKEFVAELHDAGIYVIARITVFQDPAYSTLHPELAVKRKSNPNAVWTDRKGLAFIDVGAVPFWKYIIELARESHDVIGFDELNFDYIRYPSDGNMADTLYTHSRGSKAEQLEKFFMYMAKKVRKPDASGHIPELSLDLFGMTATNLDDLTIGQVLERAMPYFDYIAPMVYPSHYPRGFHGYADPNKNAYGVVNFSMTRAAERAYATSTPIAAFPFTPIASTTPQLYKKPSYPKTQMRPWLQDFDYGGDYGPKEVREQIQATYDAGLTSWMLWSASNRYTRDALHSN